MRPWLLWCPKMPKFSWGFLALCLLACARNAPHRTRQTPSPQKTQNEKNLSREKRSGRQLDAARRLLDAGRVGEARVKLQAIVDDKTAPPRNRARAQWLILQASGVCDFHLYWQLLERFPATVAAEDALREAIRLSREPDTVWVRRLLAFYRQHPDALSAELALMEAARLADRAGTLAWRDYAVHLLTFLVRYHPDSPHRDAALYRAAEIRREQGRWSDAIRLLQQLLQTEETSMFFGDYNSEWLDDAQLLLGELYFSQGKKKDAIKAWSDLPRRFPHSRLRDRAWVRLMHLHEEMGNHLEACLIARTLLGRMPQSRFVPHAEVFLARCRQFP